MSAAVEDLDDVVVIDRDRLFSCLFAFLHVVRTLSLIGLRLFVAQVAVGVL